MGKLKEFGKKFQSWVGLDYDDEDFDFEYEDEILEQEEKPAEDMPAPMKGAKHGLVELTTVPTNLKFILVKPKAYDEVQKICDDLKSKRVTIMDFAETEQHIAQRMVDFISGAAYVLNGSVKKVSNTILVIAPQNVEVIDSIKYIVEEVDRRFAANQWF